MAIPPEFEAKILRYFHVEKWRVGTIAQQLGVHHATVDRVLSQAGLPKAERPHRASLIDPYLPFVLKTLEQYPLCSRPWSSTRVSPPAASLPWCVSAATAAVRITSGI